MTSPGPSKPTMLNVVWVKESEEKVVMVRWLETMTQENTQAGASAGEPGGGEASIREELRNVLGKLSYPLAVFSLLVLLAQAMSCPFSLWARGRHF